MCFDASAEALYACVQITPLLLQALLRVVQPGQQMLFSYRFRKKSREVLHFETLAEHFDIDAELASNYGDGGDPEAMHAVYICTGIRKPLPSSEQAAPCE